MRVENVRPLKNWCLVLADKREEKIAGGLLVLPVSETTPEKLSQGMGTIVRIGNGKKVDVLGLKVGDHVAYRGYLRHANPVEGDDPERKHFFISVEDIIGVIGEGVNVGVFSSPASHSMPALKEEKK